MAISATTDVAETDAPLQRERLLIVDRNVLLAEAIAAAALHAGYGEAQVVSGAAVALRLMQTRSATLLLIDLPLAASDDFKILHAVVHDHPDTRVVLIVDDSYDQQQAVEGLVVGADGLVYRSQGIASLLRVLEVVRGGETVIPRHLTLLILQALRQRPLQQAGSVQLSSRQREVLRLVARGLTDREISENLHISMTTVRSHLRVIFEKTETGNRTAAALWAGTHLPDLDS